MSGPALPAAEQAVLGGVPTQLFIGGQWVDAAGGATHEVVDPATGAVIARVADADVDDGVRALDAAVVAQQEWAATAPRARAEVLRRTFDLLQARSEDVALLITLEMGKPLADARGEVAYGAEFLRWFGEEAVRITGRYGSTPDGTGRMTVTRRPVGPAYLITPWNFPLAMATRKIAPALAAGCTSVIKPATPTPLSTLFLAQLFAEAGLPPGVLNVLTTQAAGPVSERIIADRRLRKLSFTGSTPVGVRLLGQAAQNVLRTSMELGGNAPFLVFEDADLDRAVEGALVAKFRNVGQACTAANRFLVHEEVAEEFGRRLAERVRDLRLGRGTDEGVTVGPLIDERAVARVGALVEDAVGRGAVLVTGGTALSGPGSFFPPTVVDAVPEGSAMLDEEIFGPVVSIVRFSDEADAIARANDTDYGLVGYVFTRDLARGQRLVDAIDTGMMGLNTGLVSNPAAPFGGVKQSGLGREGGVEGIEEYLETKYVLTPEARG